MTKIKQQLIKQRETDMKTNNFWLQTLSGLWLQNGNIKTVPEFEERVNALTSQDIADFLQKYFNAEHYVRVNTYPEK